ncbi:MAG: glycosyltransferase family 9 protein, partial [Desulfobacterales bacterium]|nr:glycosyltransferase family 9 protein [Desulfobacterales bacterium]
MNILLIQLGDIGDVVLTIPSIESLSKNFTNSNIFVAVREKAKDILEDSPLIKGVIYVNQDKRKIIKEIKYQIKFFLKLRKMKFDLAIDMRTGTRGAILAFLSGAKTRVSFYADDGKLWRNRLFTHLFKIDYISGQYVSEYYLSLLKEYGLKTDNIIPHIYVNNNIEKEAKTILKHENIPLDKPIVIIQPFSLWQYKEWQKDKYISIIKKIKAKYDVSIIITGSSSESERAKEIVEPQKDGVYNFCGKTSIGL